MMSIKTITITVLFVLIFSPVTKAMRVPGDQEFKTSFFPWEFQDAVETEWRVVRIYGEEEGQVLKIFNGEVAEIYGEKNKRLDSDHWKLK